MPQQKQQPDPRQKMSRWLLPDMRSSIWRGPFLVGRPCYVPSLPCPISGPVVVARVPKEWLFVDANKRMKSFWRLFRGSERAVQNATSPGPSWPSYTCCQMALADMNQNAHVSIKRPYSILMTIVYHTCLPHATFLILYHLLPSINDCKLYINTLKIVFIQMLCQS